MLPDHFWQKVDMTGDCWRWTAARTAKGYPIFGRSRAHRVAYEALVGTVPDGMLLDHVCHDLDTACQGGSSCPHRACVNPAHLEPVTSGENTRRGRKHAGPKAKETCIHGHPFDAANTFVDPRGWQVCRECSRQKVRRQRAGLPHGSALPR